MSDYGSVKMAFNGHGFSGHACYIKDLIFFKDPLPYITLKRLDPDTI